MNIKVRKWRVLGGFLLVLLVLGGVAIVHAGDNENPMEESNPKASFLQRLMQRTIPMPLVKDREEAEKRAREAGKWLRERQEKRDEWLAEHALEVAGETLQQSIAALYTEGRTLPLDDRSGLGSDETLFLYLYHDYSGVEASIYEFVYESVRMRHIIDLLAQSTTKSELEEGKMLVEECIADYVGSAWRLRGEDYERFNWMRAGVLPFLVFYFYEPLDGLERLNKLFDALVYASTIDLKYGIMRAEGTTTDINEYDNATMGITSTEHHIFMYVMCAYIERIITDPKYMENEEIARILNKFAENREIGLQLRNEQRRELSMPDDQFIFLIPNPKLPSGFEIQFVKDYMRATSWFQQYHTGQKDYLHYMRDILRQLAEISSRDGISQDQDIVNLEDKTIITPPPGCPDHFELSGLLNGRWRLRIKIALDAGCAFAGDDCPGGSFKLYEGNVHILEGVYDESVSPAVRTNDLPVEFKNIIKAGEDYNISSATRVGEPSAKYNCHAYSLGNTFYWLNDPTLWAELGCLEECPLSDAKVVHHYKGNDCQPEHSSKMVTKSGTTDCNGRPITLPYNVYVGKFGMGSILETQIGDIERVYGVDKHKYYK